MASFLDCIISLHRMRTNSPECYAKDLGMQLLGHSLGRDSVNSLAPDVIRHNSYECLVGCSGRSKKTTAQNQVETLTPVLYKGSKSFSPEGLLRNMETRPRIYVQMGEMSTVLRSMKAGGNMSNFKEIANDLWNCPNDYTKYLVSKEYSVVKPYLSIITTVTEEDLFNNLAYDMTHGGFIPRFKWRFSPHPPRRRREVLPETVATYESILGKVVAKLYGYFQETPMKYRLDEYALDRFEEISQELEEDSKWDDVQAFVSRYENYIVADADVITLSNSIGSFLEKETGLTELTRLTKLTELINVSLSTDKVLEPRVIPVYLVNSVNSVAIDEAFNTIKPCLEYAKKIVQYTDEDSLIQKVKNQMNKLPPGGEILHSDLMRRSHVAPHDKFKLIMHTLKEREEVMEIKKESGEGQAKKISLWYRKGLKYE